MHLLPPPIRPRSLDELARSYERCYQCPLAYSRRRIMPGFGCEARGIALVVDRVAGFDEYTGRLLSGPVGELVGRILAAPKVEIDAKRVYVTSVVLCRTPHDRMPKPREVAACNGRLFQELSLASPLLVVALGRSAGAAFVSSTGASGSMRQWHDISAGDASVPLYLTLHPREAIWGSAGEIRRKKRIIYEDWQAISARFRELDERLLDKSAEGDST